MHIQKDFLTNVPPATCIVDNPLPSGSSCPQAGWTPLMIASGNGHTPFVQFLLDESVDPEIASDSGKSDKEPRGGFRYRFGTQCLIERVV